MPRHVLLAILFGCGAPPASPAPPAPLGPAPAAPAAPTRSHAAPRAGADDHSLLRAVHACADIRSGLSGYTVFQVEDGPGRGRQVIGIYGEGVGHAASAAWVIARVRLEPIEPGGGRPNQCGQFGTPRYDGTITEPVAFDSEADARRALVDTRRD